MDIKEALTFDGLKYFYTQYIKPLKTGAFATVVNNATTTVANTVLDGRMGKTLADKDANLQNQINTLNSSLEWKVSKEAYGSEAIQFPESAKEICISSSILINNNLYTSYAYLPTASIKNYAKPYKYVYGTGGHSNTEARITRFSVSRNEVIVIVSQDESGNQIDKTYTTVWYR